MIGARPGQAPKFSRPPAFVDRANQSQCLRNFDFAQQRARSGEHRLSEGFVVALSLFV